MSYQSCHEPETLDAINLDFNPASCPQPCDCPPDGQSIADMCPPCRADYAAYRDLEELAFDDIVEILPEFVGRALGAEMPF